MQSLETQNKGVTNPKLWSGFGPSGSGRIGVKLARREHILGNQQSSGLRTIIRTVCLSVFYVVLYVVLYVLTIIRSVCPSAKLST